MPSCISVPGATFLGCSVIDFNASAGWGAQTSEVTINIVEDCTKGETFEVPGVGSAQTFVIGSFNFTGLVQSWNSKGGSGGNPLYSVKLISPAPILEYSQVILDHYEGTVPFANVFNVYGLLESLGANCGSKVLGFAEMGAPAGGFGASMKTDRGIPWQYIKQGLQALTGGWATQWTAYGGEFGYKNDSYALDLSDLPTGPMSYRIAGPVVSISDLITQVCEDAGYDYYITMTPHLNVFVIKVVVISRNPTAGSVALDTISDFVNNENHNIISKAVGRELRSDVNNFMIIGDRTRQYYQCNDISTMTPFWGWDLDGALIGAKHVGGTSGWRVYLDFRKINITLAVPMPDRAWVGENELRAALGDFESFIWLITRPTNKDENGDDSALLTWFKDVQMVKAAILDDKAFAVWNAAPDIRINAEADDNAGKLDSDQLQDTKILYNWLNSYVSDFYGRQFLVGFSLSNAICKSVDSDTGQVIYSDVISPEGGWTETAKILGLPNGTLVADQFKDDLGKVQPMVVFSGNKLNTKNLDPDDYVLINNVIWVKATVEEKWILGNPLTDVAGNYWRSALVKVSGPVIDGSLELKTLPENARIEAFTPNGELHLDIAIAGVEDRLADFGGTVSAIGPPLKIDPIGIGIPLLSNTQSYGPWAKAASVGPGSVQVEVDPGLVPWEYGSISNMNNAGLMKVNNSITSQQELERGEITVPGIPTMNLATNINSGPYRPPTLTTIRLVGTEVQTTFYTYPFALRGGAVISNISVSAGAGGVTTTYTINSFTPVFGRFTRGNADRLKQIGMNRLKGLRDMRTRGALRNLLRISSNRSNLARQVVEDIGKNARADKSPTVAFAGKYAGAADIDTGKQVMVVGVGEKDTPHYSPTEVIQTSFMTMDGFFRPVQSSEGSATYLPKVVTSTEECAGAVPTQTSGPPPPVSGQTNLAISTKYLDFLANPDGELVGDDRSNSSDEGHNIAGVARGTANSEWDGDKKGKLLMQSTAGDVDPDYNDHYRFLALRGPLMIHGWGYDINGKPIPNSEDNASVSSPTFKTDYNDLTNKFSENWLQNPATWPVAPVDLRFDRKRGVWTVPSAFRLYQIQASGKIDSTRTGPAFVLNYKDDILDEDGQAIDDPHIKVKNWTDYGIQSGAKALAYYDTAACEYWVVGAPRSGLSTGIDLVTKVCCSGANFTVNRKKFTFESGCLMVVEASEDYPHGHECLPENI